MGEPSTCNIIASASLLSLRARCLGGRLLQGDAIPPERRIWRTFSRDSLIPSSLSFSVNCAARSLPLPSPLPPPSARLETLFVLLLPASFLSSSGLSSPHPDIITLVQDFLKFFLSPHSFHVIHDREVVPRKVFFTKGVGVHKEKLASFELALRAAGLAYCNLVLVSSIYPPGCKRISKEEGVKLLRPGEIVFCVYDRESTNEPNRLVAASVGVAIPSDENQYGYLSEHHSFGETDEKAGEYAEDLAASMLATTLGIEFNPDTAWDEREQLFKMSEKIVRTTNITQSAIGNKDGLWTTVFSACVFINEDNGAPAPVNDNKDNK